MRKIEKFYYSLKRIRESIDAKTRIYQVDFCPVCNAVSVFFNNEKQGIICRYCGLLWDYNKTNNK